MTEKDKPIVIAIEIGGLGSDSQAWRSAPDPRAHFSITALRRRLAWAAAAGASAALIAEGDRLDGDAAEVGSIDPVILSSLAFSSSTDLIVIPEIDLAEREPFHLAKRLATLDHIGRGRTGWQVRAVDDDGASARDARDVIDVIGRLWDSWEDGAEIRDRATRRFIDRTRLHHVDFASESFSITGPLTVSRPPQGQIPLVLAIRSREELNFAAPPAVVRIQAATVSDAADLAADVRHRAAELEIPTPALWVDVSVAIDDATLERRDIEATAAEGRPAIPAAGSVTELARVLSEWRESIGFDGVALRPAITDIDLPLLVNGGFGDEVASAGGRASSFANLLGIPRPSSRYESPIG